MLYRSLALAILVGLLIAASTDSVASAQAVLISLAKTAPPLIIVSIAAGLVISVGEIDIASGSVLALTGMFFFAIINFAGGLDLNAGQGVWIVYWALFLSSLLTVLIYTGIGLTVAVLGFPALLSTLAILLAGRGLSVLIQNLINQGGVSGGPAISSTLSIPPSMHPTLGSGWLWASAICLGSALWRYTSFSGLRHITVGMDRRSAEIAGVNIRRARVLAFIVAGFLVALGAHLTLFQVSGGSWASNFGWGLELSAIAAAVIGGCRITGGRFDPLGIALGAIFVRATEDAAGSFNLPSEFFYIVLGFGLLLAALLDRLPTNLSQTTMNARLSRRK